MTILETLSCAFADQCSGCALIAQPYAEQSASKIAALRAQWSAAGLPLSDITEIGFRSIANGGLRDRVDLMIDQRSGDYRVGLYDRAHESILDLPVCPQLSPALQAWLEDFRRLHFNVQRGSIRLRVDPRGQRGVWLDFANVDIKNLLDERMVLESLMSQAVVEIGQRRKKLVRREDGTLKLADPELHPWFETYLGDNDRPAPLYCNVGGFTQPGFQANRVLVGAVKELVRGTQARRVVEFGSGIGNFTLPLAAEVESLMACEMDELACTAMARSLAEQELNEKVEIRRGNFHSAKNRLLPDFSAVDAVLVDPPRSGLRDFLNPLFELEPEQRPPHFIYVSCFAESFAADTARLYELGYRLSRLEIVDQFPQSPHFESVALLTRGLTPSLTHLP